VKLPHLLRRATPGDWLYAAVILLLIGANVWLVWLESIVPACDLHGHVGGVARMLRLDNASSPNAAMYQWGEFPMPNVFFPLLAYALAAIGGSLILAVQLILSLYVVVFPLCLHFFFRTFGASRWLTVAACFFIWNRFSFYGFIDYLFSIPLIFLALALVRRFFVRPTRSRWLQAAGGALLVFSAHAQSYLVFGLLLGVLGLLWLDRPARADWRGRGVRLAKRLSVIAPSLALFLPWFYRQFVRGTETVGGLRKFDLGHNKFFFDDWEHRLTHFFENATKVTPTSVEGTLFVALGLVLLLCKIVADRRGRQALGTLEIPVLALVCVGLYLVLPAHMSSQAVIYHRIAPLICLLIIAWTGPRPAGGGWRLGAVLVLPTLALCLGLVVLLHQQWRVYGEQIAGFEQVIRRAEPRTRLLRLFGGRDERGRESFVFGLFRHIHNYHVVFNDGLIAGTLSDLPGRIIGPRQAPLPNYGHSRNWLAQRRMAEQFDYVLRRYPTGGAEGESAWWKLLIRRGQWALYGSCPRKRCPP
jgi:hypothetical protein